jgi:3-deoxy-D-manno-octulosonate 8-phosphate phosphatase (KDO 8-P phosphatase)
MFKTKLKNIRHFIFDVDGVLTNGSVTLIPNGEQIRVMNIKDGFALQHAVKKGYHIHIISGGTSEAVRERLSGLGIKSIHLGISRKIEKYEDLRLEFDFTDDQVLYMGDDLPDYEVMSKVGIATCPANSAHEIKAISAYVSPISGGDGCVRDIIEQTLRLQDNWFDEDAMSW